MQVLTHSPSRARRRRTRRRREHKFHRDVSILLRHDDVVHRRQFGHWEGDFMILKQKLSKVNVTSLAERAGRFTVILKNLSNRTKPVMGKLIKAMKEPPHQARRPFTDQDMKENFDCLNNTPRKCLGWKTPAEVFYEKMMDETG